MYMWAEQGNSCTNVCPWLWLHRPHPSQQLLDLATKSLQWWRPHFARMLNLLTGMTKNRPHLTSLEAARPIEQATWNVQRLVPFVWEWISMVTLVRAYSITTNTSHKSSELVAEHTFMPFQCYSLVPRQAGHETNQVALIKVNIKYPEGNQNER